MVTKWEKIKAVERMRDHVEAHLTEPITLAALGRAARYSPWHASRMFQEITGMPPFAYVRRRRLSEAAARLRSTDQRVIDVALDFEFDSHEGFTRAFARHFGVPPQRFRAEGRPAEPFLPPRLRDWYTRRQHGEVPMSDRPLPPAVFVQILERPARKVVFLPGRLADHYFAYCEEVGCDVWTALQAVEGALHEPMGLWLPASLRPPGVSPYVQGVEVPLEWSGPVPDGMVVLDLPPCRMMVFQGPPFEDKDFEDAISTLWDVMNAYRPETVGYAWADDDGPRFQLAPLGYRGYIEGRPVRPVGP